MTQMTIKCLLNDPLPKPFPSFLVFFSHYSIKSGLANIKNGNGT